MPSTPGRPLYYLVNVIANNQHVQSLLGTLDTPFLLHQTNNDGTHVIIVIVIGVNHLNPVLGVGPESI